VSCPEDDIDLRDASNFELGIQSIGDRAEQLFGPPKIIFDEGYEIASQDPNSETIRIFTNSPIGVPFYGNGTIWSPIINGQLGTIPHDSVSLTEYGVGSIAGPYDNWGILEISPNQIVGTELYACAQNLPNSFGFIECCVTMVPRARSEDVVIQRGTSFTMCAGLAAIESSTGKAYTVMVGRSDSNLQGFVRCQVWDDVSTVASTEDYLFTNYHGSTSGGCIRLYWGFGGANRVNAWSSAKGIQSTDGGFQIQSKTLGFTPDQVGYCTYSVGVNIKVFFPHGRFDRAPA